MSKRESPSKKTEQQVQQVEFDSSPNTEWHLKHQLPQNPTLDQRVKWHMEHARRCPCPSQDEDILEELKKRYLGTHQDFWIFYTRNDHRALGPGQQIVRNIFCPTLRKNTEKTLVPRGAISTLREWVQTGEFCMAVIRGASLAAHAAAKAVKKEDKSSQTLAAHAAGQARCNRACSYPCAWSLSLLYETGCRFTSYRCPSGSRKRTRVANCNAFLIFRRWVDFWVEKTLPLLPKPLLRN